MDGLCNTAMASTQPYWASSFSPLPKPNRATSVGCVPWDRNVDLSLSSSMRTPLTPPRQRSKTPFQFRSPTAILFASSPPNPRIFSASLSETNSRLRYAALEDTPTKRKGKNVGSFMIRPVASPRPGLGYFAFPDGSPVLGPEAVQAGPSKSTPPRFEDAIHHESKPLLSASIPLPRLPHKYDTPQPCTRKLEQIEAEYGEEEWVACGGVLRDRFGNVNEARTKKVKEDIERREREKMLKARWDVYEEGWKMLAHRCKNGTSSRHGRKWKGKAKETENDGTAVKDIGFGDIPWPIWINDESAISSKLTMSVSFTSRSSTLHPPILTKKPATLQGLTVERVEDFLLSPLAVRGCTETPKGRVRRSYLRWHPDKLSWLVESVKDEDVEDVKMGIAVVLECLKRLSDRLRGRGVTEAYHVVFRLPACAQRQPLTTRRKGV